MSAAVYYTLNEAARLLKLHPQTLRRWIRGGRLPARRFGSQYRLRFEDLERAAQSPSPDDVEDLGRFDRMALGSLAELWDNDDDAVYDNWKELYRVETR